MKILVRNADDVVIHAGDDLDLTAEAVTGRDWIDRNFNASNARIEEAVLPAGYVGAAWRYAGGAWTIFNSARVADVLNHAVTKDTAGNARTALISKMKRASANGNQKSVDKYLAALLT